MKKLRTSEMVLKGHPDKICDHIADAILDDYLKHDENAKVAVEVAISYKKVFILGEVSSSYTCDMEKIARGIIHEIGYSNPEYGFTYDQVEVEMNVNEQSKDIQMGVVKDDMGAGDQGMMFGYATNETEEYMPLPYVLARNLALRTDEVKEKNLISYLRPDGKMQVTVLYEDEKPVVVTDVVISLQHDEVDIDVLRKDVKEKIIDVVIPKEYITDDTTYHINPTGRFVIGGPVGDTGLTGRKIIADTYGSFAHHGGGSFSGKDASKVDRTGAYFARYVAKNIVAKGYASRCEVGISYAIGVSEPTSLMIETYGTETIPVSEIEAWVIEHFDFRPESMIETLNLKQPIYESLSYYGHFGKEGYKFEEIITD